MPDDLASLLRAAAPRLDKINLFRNRARGGWEAVVSRGGSTWSLGIADDIAEALQKALKSEQATAPPPAAAPTEEPSIFD